jgi:hypothetical protein
VELACPSCGAINALRNPGIVVVVCDSCRTVLYREEDILRQGAESVVGTPRSSVRTGARGQLGDRRIEVLGRLRFDHGRGFWDEWFILDEHGGVGWLVEDERSFTLEARAPDSPAIGVDDAVGTLVDYDGSQWEIRETGVARLDGIEGQVDRALIPDGMYRYADLAEVRGKRRLLVEFDDDGTPEAYLGVAIPTSAVTFAGGSGTSTSAVTAAAVRCASCGAPFDLPATPDAAETAACPFCDALLDLTAAESIVVGRRREGVPGFGLELGDSAELLGTRWEVCGRVEYQEGPYTSHEYLLFHEEEGYLWLESDDGHWLYSRRAASGPPLEELSFLAPGDSADCGTADFRLASSGSGSVGYVDGAFPWRVRLEEKHQYWMLVRPPRTFTVERSGVEGAKEIEHFEGGWLPASDLLEAFGKAPFDPYEPHPAMPNPYRAWLGTAGVALFFACINLFLVLASWNSGRDLANFDVLTQSEGVSPIFHVEEGDTTLVVRFEAPVDNSWVYLDAELVDADNEDPQAVFGEEVGYYHGYEGGERWTEGSQETTRVFQPIEAGAYRLVVSSEYDRPVNTRIEVRANEVLVRYNALLSVLFLVTFVGVLFPYASFEQQRFADD